MMMITKQRWSIIIVFALIYSVQVPAQMRKIFMKDYNVQPSAVTDATLGVNKVLEMCKQKSGCELIFEPGEYHFYGERALEKYYFVSNNDEGLKRIIFPMETLKDITINGQGAKFIFHGFVNPFIVDKCSNVRFCNFTMDYARTFHSEGIILATNPDEMDLQIPEAFPYKVQNGILIFTDGKASDGRKTTVSREQIYPYGSLLEFDTKKKETAFMVRDYYINSIPLVARELGENKVRIFLKGVTGTPGNTIVFGAGHRNYPGFTVTDSRNVQFENITIHHAGGMGIVGQRSHNIRVEKCNVIPSGDRMISCTADATHFTNCTGKIELSHSTFMNQMDDATNIHGIYVQIEEKKSDNEVYVKLKHSQQFGFDFLKKGMKIEFVQGKSLITKGEALVLEVERLNKEVSRVKFNKSLPAGITVGDAIGEVRQFPEIHIHDNYIGKNRARGMLLNCRGRTLVENNTFHSPGAAILFEGDATYWFEQGGVRDCVIRNNVFDNCLYGVWGKAIIDVAAGILDGKEESRYNRNIQVYGNTFRIFGNPLLLHAYGMDNMIWKQNKVEYTKDYPAVHTNPSLYKVEYSDHITIQE